METLHSWRMLVKTQKVNKTCKLGMQATCKSLQSLKLPRFTRLSLGGCISSK